MKLKAFEADYSCGHFAPKNFKIGSVVKKLSPKNRGVGVKLVDTVYMLIYKHLFFRSDRNQRKVEIN